MAQPDELPLHPTFPCALRAHARGRLAQRVESSAMVDELLAVLSAHALAAIFLVTLAARGGAQDPAAPLLVAAGALGCSAQAPLGALAAASILANLAGDAVWFVAGKLW